MLKTDSLRWTSHMNDCLKELSEKQECAGDEVLVQQVRMQLVIEKARLCSWYEASLESVEQLRAPTALYIQTLFAQVGGIKTSIPLRLQGNSMSPLNRFVVSVI